MKVGELADELEVPASAVLEQCQRFGIDASWSGAELSGSDVVVLRAEMAGADSPLDLTPADADAEADTVAAATRSSAPTERAGEAPDPPSAAPAPAPSRSLPPTAVGSMPDLIDEVTPEIEEPPPSLGFRPAGDTEAGHQFSEEQRRIKPRPAPDKKRFDKSARNAVIWLGLAIAAFGASNATDEPAAVWALWLAAAISLVVALVSAERGRRHVTTHPERLQGLWVSVAVLGLSAVGVAVLGLSAYAAVAGPPAEDTAIVGELESVEAARWGYHRLDRIRETGWKRPAKDAGTCWQEAEDERRTDRLREEVDTDRQDCTETHTSEIALVFAMGRDLDAPYPGEDAFQAEVEERCGALVERIARSERGAGVPVLLVAEYPTEAGWADADHDVACALVTDERQEPLLG